MLPTEQDYAWCQDSPTGAADEIARLETEVKRLQKLANEFAAQSATAELEIVRLRGERDIVCRSFQDLCDVLGCEYDNEAALMAVHALKNPTP